MKYVRISFLLFAIVLFAGCYTEDVKTPPETVLSKEKMVKVLVNVHLTEAALNLNYLNDNKTHKTREYNNDVFQNENISRKQYEESLKYYTGNPEIMMEIYDEVLNELSKMQATVSENNIIVPDSMKLNPEARQPSGKRLLARFKDSLTDRKE